MDTSKQASESDAAALLIEQLSNAFIEFEAHKATTEQKVHWKEIKEHFCNLQTNLNRKREILEAKEKEYGEKEAKTRTLLAEREAVVAAKEQELLDRVQELKDAAVAVIAEVRANHKSTLLEKIDSKVSSPSYPSPTENAEGVAAGGVEPRQEFIRFCQQMDAKGLLSFMESLKNINAKDLSIALEHASEPARLVLDSLNGIYLPETKDAAVPALQGKHKSCLVLIEAMADLMTKTELGADHLLTPEIKQQAKAIANEWKKPKLFNANGNSLEAEAFLQLLATFRIASEFDEEELFKLVLVITHRRQTPELCRSLGLTHKMPDIVSSLISNGKQIDAVNLIHAFHLVDMFPPVPLLKTYLKDLRRNSQGGKVSGAAAGQTDSNAQELAALKEVIRCVEEYNLGGEYTLDPLHKRVAQLDKSINDRKRSGDPVKPQHSKRSRGNGEFRGSHVPPRQRPPVVNMKRPSYPHIQAAAVTYNYPQVVPQQQPAYAPDQTVFAQADNQRPYYYPQEEQVVSAGATSYDAAALSNYASYTVQQQQQPARQPHQ